VARLSVLIPVFNGERFISAAVASALAAGITDVEVVVQDGASEDQTLARLAEVRDPRVVVRSAPDGGQADALNRALSRATGEWVMWLNADDEILPGSVAEAFVEVPEGASAVIGNHVHIDTTGHVLKTYRVAAITQARLLRHGTFAFSGSLIVRREIAAKVKFDPKLQYCMDLDFMLRLAAAAAIPHVDVQIGCFRLQPASKTHLRPWRMYWEHFAVARRAGAYELPHLSGTVRLHAEMAAYIATRPLWRSAWWMKRRPQKQLAAGRGAGPR
jgi:glycosyltransferase involved in cell wall biosynthesis